MSSEQLDEVRVAAQVVADSYDEWCASDLSDVRKLDEAADRLHKSMGSLKFYLAKERSS